MVTLIMYLINRYQLKNITDYWLKQQIIDTYATIRSWCLVADVLLVVWIILTFISNGFI